MRKTQRLAMMSMVGLMAVSSAMPAMAAPTKVDTSTEAVTYYDQAGTGESATGDELFDAIGAYDATISKDTKVEVSQAPTLAVKTPYKIVLDGTKGVTNDADYDIQVKGDIDGSTQVNVVPNTAHKSALTVNVADVQDNFSRKDNGENGTGTGTFEMLESAGVKANITATITQEDTTWTMADDGTTDGAQQIDDADGKGLKHGNVAVANLSAGKWSNDIGFDISVSDVAN